MAFTLVDTGALLALVSHKSNPLGFGLASSRADPARLIRRCGDTKSSPHHGPSFDVGNVQVYLLVLSVLRSVLLARFVVSSFPHSDLRLGNEIVSRGDSRPHRHGTSTIRGALTSTNEGTNERTNERTYIIIIIIVLRHQKQGAQQPRYLARSRAVGGACCIYRNCRLFIFISLQRYKKH
jgi:hypothetical protein